MHDDSSKQPAKARQQARATMRPSDDRTAARSRLIEIIARQLVQQTIQDRHESLPLRSL